MSAKTAESLETPQEDIWLPQRREGIFSIFKRSIAVKSEGLLPAVLCLADTPPPFQLCIFKLRSSWVVSQAEVALPGEATD